MRLQLTRSLLPKVQVLEVIFNRTDILVFFLFTSITFLVFIAVLSTAERKMDSAALHIKENGSGENSMYCPMSHVRAEGSGWQESHLFQLGWSEAYPNRACTAPARQQDMQKHGLDAAEKLVRHKRASQPWHTTWFYLLFCFLRIFSRTSSFFCWFDYCPCLFALSFVSLPPEKKEKLLFENTRGTKNEKSVWEMRNHLFL